MAEEARAALLVEEPLHVGHPLAREAGVLGALGAGPARLALARVLRHTRPVPAAVVDVEAGDLLNTWQAPTTAVRRPPHTNATRHTARATAHGTRGRRSRYPGDDQEVAGDGEFGPALDGERGDACGTVELGFGSFVQHDVGGLVRHLALLPVLGIVPRRGRGVARE